MRLLPAVHARENGFEAGVVGKVDARGDSFVPAMSLRPTVEVVLPGYRCRVVWAVEQRAIAVLLSIKVALQGEDI